MTKTTLTTFLLASTLLASDLANAQRGTTKQTQILSFYKQELECLRLNERDTLLDIGAGEGMISAVYSLLHGNLHQVLTDVDQKVLNTRNVNHSYKKIFKKSNGKNGYSFALIHNREDSIPLKDATFSKILCRRSFHEFRRPEAMLRELRRILTDSGFVVVIEAVPTTAGEKDPVCKDEYLTAEQIIRKFRESRFELVSSIEETAAFDNNKRLSVITFKKSTANIALPQAGLPVHPGSSL